ncbi:RPOL4c domain-containing protein [Aphelenchoides fujianensis]|nr:RPOL4c domain-containing protein [Aphelenchoides fujianensis]
MAAANDKENAAELKFPKAFEVQGCALMISEVFLLLNHRHTRSQNKEEIDEVSDVLLSTLNYARRFSKFTLRDTIRAVRGIFAEMRLHEFEMA